MLAYALAALSGALYFLGFAGFDLWPLSLIALVPLMWVLDPERGLLPARRIWGLGLSAGVVMNAGGYYWIEGTLERFSGFPFAVCAAIALVLFTYQGILLVIFAFLYHHGVRHAGSRIVASVAAMCVAEWLFPMLFKHFFGASLHAVPLLMQTADLGGPLLVTGMLTLSSAGFYTALRAYLAQREASAALSAGGKFSFLRWRWREPVLALGIWLVAIGYGAYRIAEVDARSAQAPKVNMGLIQANMGLFQKREDPEEGLRRHIEQSLQLERERGNKLDLLLWPESAFGWGLPEGIANVRDAVLGNLISTPTLFGGLAIRRLRGKRRFFNTAFMTNGKGDVTGTYDKAILVPFSEYMPLAEELPILQQWSPNSGNFAAGAHVRPLRFGKFRLSVLICYEDILPSFVRRVEREAKPHALINLTNDAWFGDTHAPWEHLALAKLRSVEHHRALVRATNSGVSAVIDPVGRVVATSALFSRENLFASVPMLNVSYPYHVLGDFPGPLSLLVLVGLWLVQKKRQAQS
jgi:apolipoprotein N-acyltransferase